MDVKPPRASGWLHAAVAFALVLSLASAAVVWAQTSGRQGRAGRMAGQRAWPGPMLLNHVARELNLTPGQMQQVKDIVRMRRNDVKAVVGQAFAARKSLREAIAANDRDRIAAAVGQVSAAELKGAELRADIRAKVFSDVLTADQRTRADQLMAEFERKADQWQDRIDAFLDGLH